MLHWYINATQAQSDELLAEELSDAEKMRARARKDVQVCEAGEHGSERRQEAEGAGKGGDRWEAEARVVRLHRRGDLPEVQVVEMRVRLEKAKEGVVEVEGHPEGEAAETWKSDTKNHLEHEEIVPREPGFEEIEREVL